MKKVTLLATLLISILTLGATPFASAQDKTPGKDGDTDPKAPVILLVPPVFAINASLADGCWARLFDGKDYRGDVLTLAGPIDIPKATLGTTFAWGRKYDSVIVGPNATLTVYDHQDYKDKTATFKAGQKVPDTNEKLGFFEQIQSLKVTCTK